MLPQINVKAYGTREAFTSLVEETLAHLGPFKLILD